MIKRLTLIVGLLFTVITNAQEGTSSPYSFYGIGLTTFKGTVENRSMGGLSFYTDSIHVNLRNPASYGQLGLTTYSIGGTHSIVNIESATESEKSTVTSLDYIAIGVPAGRIGFGFGLIPYTSVGYNLLDFNEEDGTAARFEGSGGLNKVYLSSGYSVNKNFQAGVTINYNFGNIRNKNVNARRDIQLGTREINRSDLSGFNFNFGLNYQEMISDELQLTAAAIYSPASHLKSKNQRELATVLFRSTSEEIVADRRDIPLENTEMSLPAEYTLGTGIGKPRKWFLGIEYTGTGESNFNNRSFSLINATYSNASKYKIGGYYIPDYNSLTNYFNRIVYRGGFRMEETGLSLNGEAINEFGISFGVALPAGGMLSNANLGFEYGQRGTTNAGLIQESFFNVSVGLSLNDRWFIKRRFE